MNQLTIKIPQESHTEINVPELKKRMKNTWSDGDYARFARYMENGAINVLENWRIEPGTKMLDVGCGSGQTAIPSAKKGIHVSGVDIAENLIDAAKQRAAKANLRIQFDVGDAEQLPYHNDSFDTAISMFGAMFAPRPQLVVEEFARVIKSGGKLFMANWTPGSMPAQMFKCVAEVTPPPKGVPSPIQWGIEDEVIERLQNHFTDIKLARKIYPEWNYPFPTTELVNVFRENFGPVKRAFDKISNLEQDTLYNTLENIYRNNSVFENGILTITNGEFLEIEATRR